MLFRSTSDATFVPSSTRESGRHSHWKSILLTMFNPTSSYGPVRDSVSNLASFNGQSQDRSTTPLTLDIVRACLERLSSRSTLNSSRIECFKDDGSGARPFCHAADAPWLVSARPQPVVDESPGRRENNQYDCLSVWKSAQSTTPYGIAPQDNTTPMWHTEGGNEPQFEAESHDDDEYQLADDYHLLEYEDMDDGTYGNYLVYISDDERDYWDSEDETAYLPGEEDRDRKSVV